jgi:hypothetical protein
VVDPYNGVIVGHTIPFLKIFAVIQYEYLSGNLQPTKTIGQILPDIFSEKSRNLPVKIPDQIDSEILDSSPEI